MSQHAFFFVCVRWLMCVFVHSSCLSFLYPWMRNNFLPSVNLCLSPYVVACSPRAAGPPSLWRVMQLRQIPAGRPLWCQLAVARLWILRFSMCVWVCACLIVWRISVAHWPKQLKCMAAFRNTGLFSPPIHCPPAVCLSCSAPKETPWKSHSAPTQMGCWLPVHRYKQRMASDLCTIWGPIDSHTADPRIHCSLPLPKMWDYWFSPQCNRMLTLL